ncbi:MAG TPA: maleylpyruvate isomerase N-terminal domain-containing protein [Acidimicrobiales bacterium]|nr:maleylpyruvate isomerase N-terminal domain-containing protein [Acidimicrobiales bacterium]
MRLRPRYGDQPVVRFDGPIGDPAKPLLRQRRRLGDTLKGLDADQWAAASRCEGWSVRDVVAHLVTTNGFWVVSALGALAGEPTRYLSDFDPVASPKVAVDSMLTMTTEDVLTSYIDGVEKLAAAVEGLDDAQWSLPAEAPPGHIALAAMARHALWDAWIHERDVCIPLGYQQPEEDDEVLASLEYAAALGAGFLALEGSPRSATLVVDATGPETHFVIDAGESVVVRGGDAPADALRITGSCVDLVEALSFRVPFPAGVGEETRWLFAGLGTVFEVAEA